MSERRRNLWSGNSLPTPILTGAHNPNAGPDPTSSPSPVTGSSPPALIDSLRVAEVKQRDRRWERDHHAFTYRGIPTELKEAVKEVAENIQVNTDEVARVFLEFGLQCHRFGEIQLRPNPKGQRMTLFPENDKSQPAWFQKFANSEPAAKLSKGKKTKGNSDQLWRKRVSYRLPVELHTSLRQVAEDHYVPVGEVVIVFLGHALEAYQVGRLVLNPQPRI